MMEENQTTAPALPSAFSLFRPSLDALMVNIWTFVGLFLVPMAGLMLAVPLAVGGRSQESIGAVVALIGIAAMIFLLVVGAAVPYVELKSVQGKQVALGEALRVGLRYFWRFYGLSIVVGFAVLGGLILFIVPGLFMIRRYYLAPFYMYDQNLGIFAAMRKSAADSKRFSGAIWGLLGVTVLIQMPAVIPIFGLIAIALSLAYYCAPAVRYFQIKSAVGTKH